MLDVSCICIWIAGFNGDTPMTPNPQPEYIINESTFNHVVAALRDNRHYDVAEYLIHNARPHTPAKSEQEIRLLDELETIIKRSKVFAEVQCIERVSENARDYYNVRASTLEFVLDKIVELRKQGGEP